MQEGNKFFSECLKKSRKAYGITQKELASKVNIGQTTVAGYENGRRLPDRKTVLKIAKALNVSAEELLNAAGIENEETEEAPPVLTKQELEARLMEACNQMNYEGLQNVLTVVEWLLTSNRYRKPKTD